jgi:hypothetical protein
MRPRATGRSAFATATVRSGASTVFCTVLDTVGQRKDVNSPNPKVYLPIGNCLMGHVDGPDAMALAWMNSAGVVQMAGYTVPTWFGYMGWGLLDYFVEQPGRYTYAEAFFANQQALIHRLVTEFPALVGEKPKPGSTSRKGRHGRRWAPA